MAPVTTVVAREKERLEVLEASLGTVQSDLHNATGGLAEKIAQIEGSLDERFRTMEHSFQQTLEESMHRMRELMAQTHESSSRVPASDNRTAGFGRHDRTDQPARHQRPKLKLQRFSGGDPT